VILSYFQNPGTPKSLSAQIKEAEYQVLNRQRKVGVRTAKLVQQIHRRLTDPATLLLSVGIGFIIGELTKSQAAKPGGTTDKRPGSAGISPIKIALNLLTSLQTLYATLPMVWILKTFLQPDSSVKTSGHPNSTR
jgi:hypothetical protein